MGIYICLLLALSCLGILIYSTFTSDYKFRLISKIFTSLCFLLIALLSYLSNANNLKYFLFIFIGLVFSFLGDILLGIKAKNSKSKNTLIILGGFNFAITHILYSLCFITLSGLHIRDFIFAIFLSFILLSTLKCNKKIDFNNSLLPISIYCLIISFMVCKAISLVTITSLNLHLLMLLILGAILFIISDYILAFVILYKDCPKYVSRLNLIFYYIGQILIALSILYI